MSALAIANNACFLQEREDAYLQIISKYSGKDLKDITQLFSYVVLTLAADPHQDFLGTVFHELSLANSAGGQYFTPYHIAQLITQLTDSLNKADAESPYVTVYDPACGSGALLLATANTMCEKKEIPETHLFAIVRDISPCLALMSYIQLSILDIPGYAIIGDSLNSSSTNRLVLTAPAGAFCTPMYFSPLWAIRRKREQMEDIHEQASKNIPTLFTEVS